MKNNIYTEVKHPAKGLWCVGVLWLENKKFCIEELTSQVYIQPGQSVLKFWDFNFRAILYYYLENKRIDIEIIPVITINNEY